jgi:hypothetical protein
MIASTSRKKLREYFVVINTKAFKTVPQTDTGELVEYTKALERTMLKELGKMTP